MPVVTALEKYEFIKGQPFVSSVPTSLKHFDYLGWIKQAEEFCTDKHLQFMNSVHEVGKRKDNTLGTLAFKDKFDFEIEESQDDPNQMTVKSFCAAPVSDPKAESKEIENTTLEPMPAPEKNKETPENFLDHQKKIAKELDDFFGDDGQGPQGFQNPIVK